MVSTPQAGTDDRTEIFLAQSPRETVNLRNRMTLERDIKRGANRQHQNDDEVL